MNNQKALASMMGVWIGVGVAIGIATHQLALWLAIGIAIGAAMSGVGRRKSKGSSTAAPKE